jgi:prolyl oligopeptidase
MPAIGRADELPLQYPQAARGDVVDDYHGVRISDPYRWLEDLDAPSTRDWLARGNLCVAESPSSTARSALVFL